MPNPGKQPVHQTLASVTGQCASKKRSEYMYAIVDIAGKQYKVSEKDKLYVPLQSADVNKSVSFSKVLLLVDGDAVTVGMPMVKGAAIKAKVLDHVKADKVIVFKKKRRKRYRVKKGHRQPYTQIEIKSISVK